MKLFLIFLLFQLNSLSFAGSLKCSANGTDVYYINGVLTNKDKNDQDTKAIAALFKGRNDNLDSGSPFRIDGKTKVQFFGIHNASFGLLNDVAELFAQAYYANTGTNGNARAIFNLIRNMPDNLQGIVAGVDPNDFGSKVGMFGLKLPINFASLKFIAGENFQTALSRSLASTEALTAESEVVSNNIASAVIRSKQANRKVLFVAHSQGNAALVAGVKKLEIANVPSEIEYMQKYMGTYHVASPVPPLVYPYKEKDIRLDQDKVISAAQLYSDQFIPPEFKITTAPITHDVVFRENYDDLSGHYFYDTYLSPTIIVKKRNDSKAQNVIMSENFVSTLSDLATDLEDNCAIPIIKLDYQDRIGVEGTDGVISLSGSFGNVKLSAQDTNTAYDNSKTTFTWSIPTYTGTSFNAVYPVYRFDWTNYALNKSPQDPININPINFNVPYKAQFNVTVTATNSMGKQASLTKTFKFSVNQPPVIQCYSMMIGNDGPPFCGEAGSYYDGAFGYDCFISDDSQRFAVGISGDGGENNPLPPGDGGQQYIRLINWHGEFMELRVKDSDGQITVKSLPNYCK